MQQAGQRSFADGLTLRQAAVITGITYLLNPVTFAELYAMPRLIAQDPAQTITNITRHPHLFSAAVLAYVFSLVGDVVFAWSFYYLLAPVDRALSLLAACLRLVYAAVSLSAVANLGVLYRLLLVSGYTTHSAPSERSAQLLGMQTTQLLTAFHSGWGLGLLLFGVNLVIIGWLIARSTYMPRWLGWLLFLDGWAWVLNSLSMYLFPSARLGYLNAVFAVELILMVWLLGWGWRIQQPRAELIEAATSPASAPVRPLA